MPCCRASDATDKPDENVCSTIRRFSSGLQSRRRSDAPSTTATSSIQALPGHTPEQVELESSATFKQGGQKTTLTLEQQAAALLPGPFAGDRMDRDRRRFQHQLTVSGIARGAGAGTPRCS